MSDTNRGERDSWTPQNVADLARVVAAQGDDSDLNHVSGLDAVLATHPKAALVGRLTQPPGDYFQFQIGRLCGALPVEEVNHLIEVLADDSMLLTEAGVTVPTSLDRTAVAEAKEYFATIARARRTSPSSIPSRPNPAEQQRKRVDDTIVARTFDQLITMPPSEVLPRLDKGTRAKLKHKVAQGLVRLRESGQLVRMAALPSVPVRDLGVLTFAAQLQLPLSADDWIPVALFALHWFDEDLQRWCRDNYRPEDLREFLDAVTDLDLDAATHVHKVVPRPLPDQLIDKILSALESGAVQDGRARTTVAELIGAGAGDSVRAWAPDPVPEWLLPLLVQIGDCDAEATMLTALAADPDKLARWPARYETRWIDEVHCPDSANLLQAAARSALVAGRETNDVSQLLAALKRVSGLDVLRRYDEMIADNAIPYGSFLYYPRQAALNALIEKYAQQALPLGTQLEAQLRAVGRP